MTSMPEQVDSFIHPTTNEVPSGPHGRTAVVSDLMDAVKAVSRIVVGPACVNVKSDEFVGGARGNGIHDDGPPIRAAVNAVAAAGGGLVYFPPGTYLVSTGITGAATNGKVGILLKSGVALRGSGWGTSIVLGTNLGVGAIPSALIGTLVNSGASNMAIEDMVLDGAGITQSGSVNEWVNSGIYMDLASRWIIRNVWIKNFQGDGIYTGNPCSYFRIEDVDINDLGTSAYGLSLANSPHHFAVSRVACENITSTGQTAAIRVNSGLGGTAPGDASNWSISDCRAINCHYGLWIGDVELSGVTTRNVATQEGTICGFIAESCQSDGVRIESSAPIENGHKTLTQRIQMSAILCDTNGGHGINLVGGALSTGGNVTEVSVVGYRVRGNAGNGLNISDAQCQDNFFDGGVIVGNGGSIANIGTNTTLGSWSTGTNSNYILESPVVAQESLSINGNLVPNGKTIASQQIYPASESLAQQTSGGLLHATAVPSNANGANNDWCISDNGHLYFKTAGAWVQKA